MITNYQRYKHAVCVKSTFCRFETKVCLHIHVVVLQRGLPSLDDKLECFVTKSGNSGGQTRVRQTIAVSGNA